MNEAALKDRIHTIATQKNITFNECWKQLLLERFLVRLANSEFTNRFIFKGGLLLSYLVDIGRETVDLDFVLRNLTTETKELKSVIESIANCENEDGFIFHCEKIEELSHLHMNYLGYRITVDATFGTIKDKIHLDLGIGDVVEPEPLTIDLLKYRDRPIFEHDIQLMVYPVETIFAEKLETVVSRGAINSRMKDFHDLFVLINNPSIIELKKLKHDIFATFSHRGTALNFPMIFDSVDIKKLETSWSRYLHGLGDIHHGIVLHNKISDIITAINAFLEKIDI